MTQPEHSQPSREVGTFDDNPISNMLDNMVEMHGVEPTEAAFVRAFLDFAQKYGLGPDAENVLEEFIGAQKKAREAAMREAGEISPESDSGPHIEPESHVEASLGASALAPYDAEPLPEVQEETHEVHNNAELEK